MNIRKDLEALFVSQDLLNKETCGEDWKDGFCDNGKKSTYVEAAICELAEYLESTNWKHWKETEEDTENAKVELVDTMFFVLSMILSKRNEERVIDDFIVYASEPRTDTPSFLGMIKNIVNFNDTGTTFVAAMLISDIIRLAEIKGLDWKAFKGLYIGKNALNYLRTRNGYKDGKYIKVWDGVEDNKWMMKYIEEDFETFDELYNKLEAKYKEISQ